MYQIFYNDALVYDPRLANGAEPGDLTGVILDGTLKLAIGSGGQLTFTLPAGHPMIGTIELKAEPVKVTEVLASGTNVVFLGRVIRMETAFDNSVAYECEGRQSYLCDTVVRPGSFPPYSWSWEEDQEYQAAIQANTVPEYRLGKLLDAHNAMAGAGGEILLGDVTVTGGAMERSSSEWLTTWERLLMEFTDSDLGGFFQIRYADGTAYLDYLAGTDDFTEYNAQRIDFGANLAEITRETSGGTTFNAVLPVNSKGSPQLIPLFIPDGPYDSGRYIKSGYVMRTAGAPSNVVTVEQMSLTGTAAQVAQQVCDWLDANAGASVVNALTVKAYDLSASDPNVEPFRVGKLVKILDPPHNIREAYLVMGITVDLTGGADVDLDLGAQVTSLTASGAQRINEETAARRVPKVLYRNTSPGTAQSSGALGSVPDISAYNLFFIEVCWGTSYTSHRAGTWVYVPDGTAVIAHPSVDWYDSGAAHTYRQVTINKSNSAGSQISLGAGNKADSSGTSEGTGYAVVTTIIGY